MMVGYGLLEIKAYHFIIGLSTMIKNSYIIPFIVLYFFSCSNRVETDVSFSKKNNFLDFDIVKSSVFDDYNEVDVQIEFPINKLIFKKNKNGFLSVLTIDIIAVGDDNKISLSDSWNETIEVDYYDETKSYKNVEILKTLKLKPGNYKFNVIINDYENHLNWVKVFDFNIDEKNYTDNFSVLYKDGTQLRELVGNNLSLDYDSLWIDYNVNEKINLEFEIKYIEVLFEDDFLYLLDDKNNLEEDFWNDENNFSDGIENKEIVMKKNILLDEFDLNENKIIPLPLTDIFFNMIEINLSYKDIIISKTLGFIDLSKIEYDLSILIGPMYYVLDADYYGFESMEFEEQKKYIKDYWENISENDNGELFREFYKRVIYANKNFNYLSTQGWDTDKGRIYIINGKPEKISYDFSDQTEFEIWEYENRNYIFVNNGGYYELYNPNYRNY
ncbi:MAG: hypothetical protein CMG46_01095 [Candidatus Marinimicrobia bacterium]|nr:hypothetical protein [Candidatus Neomarinimicrobiota bacterium]